MSEMPSVQAPSRDDRGPAKWLLWVTMTLAGAAPFIVVFGHSPVFCVAVAAGMVPMFGCLFHADQLTGHDRLVKTAFVVSCACVGTAVLADDVAKVGVALTSMGAYILTALAMVMNMLVHVYAAPTFSVSRRMAIVGAGAQAAFFGAALVSRGAAPYLITAALAVMLVVLWRVNRSMARA